MKKKLVVLLSVMTILLCGCQKSNEGTAESQNLPVDYEVQMQMIAPYTGIAGQQFAMTDDGFYELTPAKSDDALVVLYTDFQTLQRVYLSNQINPTLDEENPTFISPIGGCTAPMIAGDKLIIFSQGDNFSKTNPVVPMFVEMDLNGANKRFSYVEPNINIHIGSAAVFDGKYVYVLGEKYDDKGNKIDNALYRINFDNSKAEEFFSLNTKSRVHILGVYKDGVVIQQYSSNGKYRISLLSIKENKITPTEFEWATDSLSRFVENGVVYYCSVKGTNLEYMDLISGEHGIIADFTEEIGDEQLYPAIFDIKDNRATIGLAEKETMIPVRYYFVDLDTKKIDTLKLTYPQDGGFQTVYPFNESSEYFIVISRTEIKTQYFYMENGEAATSEGLFPTYSLIKKSDYWNGISAYLDFTDTTH